MANNKRLFQILDEMNVNDDINKTATCGCCFELVAANKVKAGGHVTMGVPAEAVMKIFLGEYQPILILMDKKEYNRLKDLPVADSPTGSTDRIAQTVINNLEYLEKLKNDDDTRTEL